METRSGDREQETERTSTGNRKNEKWEKKKQRIAYEVTDKAWGVR